MRAGGTCDLPALNEDLNQITDGNYAALALITLPLLFKSTLSGNAFGSSWQIQTPSGSNPVIGQIPVTRVTLLQPANSLTLIPDAIDENGNYVASYPFQTLLNLEGDGLEGYKFFQEGTGQFFAKGFIRLNGAGMWIPMSLMPFIFTGTGATTGEPNTQTQGTMSPWSGFSSLAGPISFFDWVGGWDGTGETGNTLDPDATVPSILAMAAINLNAMSPGNGIGSLVSYATPNSSGRQPGQGATNTTQKQQDILVRAGNGKKGCP
jgi:hypothetical protein